MGEFCDIGNEFSRRTFLARGAAAGGAVVLGGRGLHRLAGCSSVGIVQHHRGPGPEARGRHRYPGPGRLAHHRHHRRDRRLLPPANHWDTNGFIYANAVYDPLMAMAADGSIQPYLAESMTPNSHLRRVDDDPPAGHQVQRRLAPHLDGGQGQLHRPGGLGAHRPGPQAGGVGDHPGLR